MAKCNFPIALARSYYRTGSKGCSGKAIFDIIFQGKPMKVCKMHKQYNGRDRISG